MMSKQWRLGSLVLVVGVVFAPEVRAQAGGWNGFKVGSWAKLTTTSLTEAAGQKIKTVVEMKQTVKEVGDMEATLETETATTTVFNGSETKIPPATTQTKVPIVPPTPSPSPGPDGSVEAIPTPPPPVGQVEEVLNIAGKAVKCSVVSNEMTDEGTKSTNKMWYSLEVPGGLVKMEATTEGEAKVKNVTELIDFEALK